MTDIKDPVVPENGQPSKEVTDPEHKEGTPVNPPVKDPVKDLISQRDKNFTKAKSLEEEVAELKDRQNYSEAITQKREFLDSLTKDSNLTPLERKLLDKAADSEDAAKETLAEILDYRKDAEQKALQKIQDVDSTPRYTEQSAAEKLETLKDSGDLEGAIAIKLNTR